MIKSILKLSASWCAPCRVYAPTFHRVSKYEKYKDIEFKEYDIEEEDGEEMALKYNVRSVPTTILLDENEKILYKVMGNVPENQLTKIIDETLKTE